MAANMECNAAIEAAREGFFQAPAIEEVKETLAPLSPQERWTLGLSGHLPQCTNATPVAYFRLCDAMETLTRGHGNAV